MGGYSDPKEKAKPPWYFFFFIFFLEIDSLMLSSPWPPLAGASTVTNVANNSNNDK